MSLLQTMCCCGLGHSETEPSFPFFLLLGGGGLSGVSISKYFPAVIIILHLCIQHCVLIVDRSIYYHFHSSIIPMFNLLMQCHPIATHTTSPPRPPSHSSVSPGSTRIECSFIFVVDCMCECVHKYCVDSKQTGKMKRRTYSIAVCAMNSEQNTCICMSLFV